MNDSAATPDLLDRSRFVYLTVVSVGTLYVPQPILPNIAKDLLLTNSEAALLTTAAFLPLSVLPLAHGAFLELIKSRTILYASLTSLLITNMAIFVFSHYFLLIMVFRLTQGIAISAILTFLTSYLSKNGRAENLNKLMSWYVASTIIGGFLGRISSAVITSLASWQYTFLFDAANATLCVIMIGRTHVNELSTNMDKTGVWTISAFGVQIRDHTVISILAIIFCCFFVFSSILNFFPFHLKQLYSGLTEYEIGLMYSAYPLGATAALLAPRFIGLHGTVRKAVISALTLFGSAIACWFLPSIPVMFMSMVMTCVSMFLVQAMLTGFLNGYVSNRKAVANGMYIAAYYSGGTAGSYLPGLVYDRFGWSKFLVVDLLVLAVAMIFAGRLKNETSS
ncbi:MAG: MFS transporter [Gammaproteobacteria bacterium]|nr:MFS transporter [Gammaproteobacteria bacterium]